MSRKGKAKKQGRNGSEHVGKADLFEGQEVDIVSTACVSAAPRVPPPARMCLSLLPFPGSTENLQGRKELRVCSRQRFW